MKKKKTKKRTSQKKDDYSQSVYMLAIAKKMNMRIPEELLEISFSEFLDITDVYFSSNDQSESGVREATQEDIDRMLG